MVEGTPELGALFPVGTGMPSVITEAPFEGDRGDVTAVAEWRDGWWRMEVKRTLAAASDYDVSIGDGTYLWVSVFDHADSPFLPSASSADPSALTVVQGERPVPKLTIRQWPLPIETGKATILDAALDRGVPFPTAVAPVSAAPASASCCR